MNLTENLKWRYATKKFDASRKISSENLEKIKEAVQLSASSYGLQLYKVFILEDRELREKLKAVSWGQRQITDASYLIVFCNYSEVKDEHVDEYLQLKARAEQVDIGDFKGYGDFMKKKIQEKSATELRSWTASQTYLALGNLLAACAELKVDACPMEGFEPEAYNKILGLTEQGLNAAVIAAIGYRSEDDPAQQTPKVRKPVDMLFETR